MKVRACSVFYDTIIHVFCLMYMYIMKCVFVHVCTCVHIIMLVLNPGPFAILTLCIVHFVIIVYSCTLFHPCMV